MAHPQPDGSRQSAVISSLRRWLSQRWWLPALALVACAIVAVIASPAFASPAANQGAHQADHAAAGAGRTIIEGGTGGGTPVPVTTTVAFHATAQGGDFECLALAPASPSSGQFTMNAMYVTGAVTSLEVSGHTATLHGSAKVTGLGAGSNLPFTAQVSAGGPGATVTLTVSGMTFHEILLEGSISVE
jgi:hypothetical protein